MIHLLLAGDVVLGRRAESPEEPWGDLPPILRAADVRIVNLNCAIRPEIRATESLIAAGIDACALANDRTLELGRQGLLDTMGRLDLAGVHHAGAGKTLAEARRPEIWSVPSDPPSRVALISVTEGAMAPSSGINSFTPDLEPEGLAWVSDSIRQARQAGAQVVVLSYHATQENAEMPSPVLRRFAEFVIEQGADVFHGHGSHLFKGVEIYRDKPILYDSGDLLDDTVVHLQLRSTPSFLFLLGFDGSEFRRLELVPLHVSFPEVNLACGRDADRVLHRMRDLSAAFGTEFHREGERLFLERWPGAQAA